MVKLFVGSTVEFAFAKVKFAEVPPGPVAHSERLAGNELGGFTSSPTVWLAVSTASVALLVTFTV